MLQDARVDGGPFGEAPSAEVTATALNEVMVAFEWTWAPGAVRRWTDVQRLPLPNEDFDLMPCQSGVMFFPDCIEAFAEVGRVLAPGGWSLNT